MFERPVSSFKSDNPAQYFHNFDNQANNLKNIYSIAMKMIAAFRIIFILAIFEVSVKPVEARRRRARFGRPSTRRMVPVNQNDATDDIDRCLSRCQSRPLQKLALLNRQ